MKNKFVIRVSYFGSSGGDCVFSQTKKGGQTQKIINKKINTINVNV